MNRVGLTAIHMMDGTLATPDECRALEQSGRLTAGRWCPSPSSRTAEDELIEAAIAAGAQPGRLWRSGWAKFFIDGVVETGTAWLEEPDTQGRGMEPNWPDPGRYAATVIARFAEAGFPSHHARDRRPRVRCALDAYRRRRGRRRAARTGSSTSRPRRTRSSPGSHRRASWPRSRPTTCSGCRPDVTIHGARSLGPERRDRGFRIGDLRRSGAVLALGSDWPVAGYDPREGMGLGAAAPRGRATATGSRSTPSRLISGIEALEGYTTHAAAAVSDDAVAGRIAPGYRATSPRSPTDPVECDPDDLMELPVC